MRTEAIFNKGGAMLYSSGLSRRSFLRLSGAVAGPGVAAVPKARAPRRAAAPLHGNDKHYPAEMGRTFIRCALDHAVPIGAQETLIQAADAFTSSNPTRTATLQSSHSSFFSMPAQLASVLGKVARALP